MGKGGHRYGAGRPGHKVKAEHCRRLDVRDLARCKVLGRPGHVGWQWSNRATGEVTGSIGIDVAPDSLKLTYSVNGESAEQRVELDRTACNYGGARPWLRCPLCGRRVGVLFLRGARFKCRHCANVAYGSQSEDSLGRAWRLQQKLEQRLGENWARPKGMRRSTREKIIERIFACKMMRENALATYLKRRGLVAL